MSNFKKYINRTLILLLLLISTKNHLIAQKVTKAQSIAVPFLLINPDSKSSGMGNTSMGMSTNTNDLFQNASKLATIKEKNGFTLNYTPWLKDLELNNVYLLTTGYYKKLNASSAFHVSLRYFTLGSIDLTDDKGTPNRPAQKTGEGSLNAGYSLKISDKLSLGTTLKYIYSNLIYGNFNGTQYKAGSSIAGDISLYYQQNENAEGLHMGMLLSNLGGKISYANNSKKYFIPANIGMGLGYLKNIDEKNGIEFGIDVNRLLVPALSTNATQENLDDYYSQSVVGSWANSLIGNYSIDIRDSYSLSLGLEYNYDKIFYLRTGYNYGKSVSAGKTDYITTGASFKYNKMLFNLSYIPPISYSAARNPISNTFSFGTSIHF
jgi:hypothetical protein